MCLKRLQNPHRRAILDLLRKRPRTTGEIADAFPRSRFNVMKNLAALVGAGLVVSRRKGRERWNHLNAVPLQRVYERWVRLYEAHWAEGLVRLQDRLEGESAMPTTSKVKKADGECSVVSVELGVAIAAPIERVWKAITEEATVWWRRDFYVGKNAKGFHFEAKLGGRMYEDWGKGQGVIWGQVIGIDAPRELQIVGHLMPEFGGPATHTLRLLLDGTGKQTKLQLSNAVFGKSSPTRAKEVAEGWSLLFQEGLKQWVENDVRA